MTATLMPLDRSRRMSRGCKKRDYRGHLWRNTWRVSRHLDPAHALGTIIAPTCTASIFMVLPYLPVKIPRSCRTLVQDGTFQLSHCLACLKPRRHREIWTDFSEGIVNEGSLYPGDLMCECSCGSGCEGAHGTSRQLDTFRPSNLPPQHTRVLIDNTTFLINLVFYSVRVRSLVSRIAPFK